MSTAREDAQEYLMKKMGVQGMCFTDSLTALIESREAAVRERCALICDGNSRGFGPRDAFNRGRWKGAEECAEAIRQQKDTP